ncbi:MAG: aminotransferase class I/II-fold pyridoxal phosphate-dependent enzyme [Actinomycetota bacterium]|nr:aminotransferase class I/II-fold pyridoxal phosphate-dependent enzyme [Actinomycetota bacterium]
MRRFAFGYVLATLPVVVIAFALPQHHLFPWGLLGWSASAAVVVGAFRNRPGRRLPWLLIAAALALFVSGDMTYDFLTEVLHQRDPFPSAADVFYLATYPLFACGLLALLRARHPGRNLGSLLDPLIVAASCAIFVMEPYVRDAETTPLEKTLSIAYPLGDITILCMLGALLWSVGFRNWSARLLAIGALGLLVADVFYGGTQLDGNWKGGGLIDLGWAAFYVCWGAAALHPSMRELSAPQPRQERHLSVRGLLGLSAATLVAPGLLVWQAATDGVGRDVGEIGATSGVVFLMVLARMASLARAQTAQVARERALVRDVSARMVVEGKLRHQAFHDSLTGLANRALFYDRIDQALSVRAGAELSVLLLDLDDFKLVNDTFGHPTGDQLLVLFAARLLRCLRGEDTAARLGGDEFAICTEMGASRSDVAATAHRILNAVAEPFRIADTSIDVRVTIGISMAVDATEDALDMLRQADSALYAAKAAGKGSLQFYEVGMRPAAAMPVASGIGLENVLRTIETYALPGGFGRNAPTTAGSGPFAEQDRRDARWTDLERLRASCRMMDAVIDEVHGRRIRIGDQWLSDFASCNYLGFDLDEEIIDSVDGALRQWGTHPSWSRLLGSPRLYGDIESQLTELLGAPDTLVLPTITHIHGSVIPVLAGQGRIFVDSHAHKTVFDAAAIAAGQGAVLRRFRSDDGRATEDLERLLDDVPAGVSRLVCMDGVNSMTGNVTDVAAFARMTRAHDALLYIDDAHGFGVIGERGKGDDTPYGRRGNCIVRYAGESYDNLVLVGGFSKAYSSLLAFLALPTWLKNHLKVAAAPYLYSGPSPTASLATVLAGMHVNLLRGDAIRADLYRKTSEVLATVEALGLATANRSGLPIIEIPLDRAEDIDAVGEFLFDHGIYVTLAAYPLVPRRDVGFRIQVTAANSDEQVEQLCFVLGALQERFALQRSPAFVPD